MIPIIGVMMGSYIVVRMLDLITDETRPRHVVVRAFAAAALLVAIIGIGLLVTSQPEITDQLQQP